MTENHAIVVDPNAPDRLAIRSVPSPSPAPSEATVRVEAISLNLGEVRRIASAPAGWRPGWDIAGVVEQAAADGSGPSAGTRVVGVLDSGAWAQYVAIHTNHVAAAPPSVSSAQAATLPVAGLTALRTLERGGLLVERSVLITGASGGVGHLAIQIARAAGAHVVGVVHHQDREAAVRDAGAQEVVAGDVEGAKPLGPYHLILESVGGADFSRIVAMLAPAGTCVLYGTSAGPELTFDGRGFYLTGGASLYGFILFYEMDRNPPAADLARLVLMVADGTLKPQISVETSWTEIGAVARDLAERRITGKAVLRVD